MVATSDTPGNGDAAGGSSGDSISLSTPSPNSSPAPSSPNSSLSPSPSSLNSSPSPIPSSPNSSPAPSSSSPSPSPISSSPNSSPAPSSPISSPSPAPNASPAPSSSNSGSSGSSASTGCQDIVPPGDHSCSVWKDWGKCSEIWLVSNNYCAATCSRCGSGASSGQGVSGDPKVQSFDGPSDSPAPPSGRKLLRRLL